MPGVAEVAVAVANLRLAAQRGGELATRLNGAERARADAFHRASDRDRFVLARGLLRELLARELGLPAAAVPLLAAAGGKPQLDPGAGLGDLCFNASRSGERALFALARGRSVGVDVERMRELEFDGVAARTFSSAELEAWAQLADGRREAAFFAAWARKEAYAKGRGEGLEIGLSRVQPRATTQPGRHLVAAPDGDAPPWTVEDVAAGEGYAAAVAAEGTDWRLRVEALGP